MSALPERDWGRRSVLRDYCGWLMCAVYGLLIFVPNADLSTPWFLAGFWLTYSLSEHAPDAGWRFWMALFLVPALAFALVQAGLAAYLWIAGTANPDEAEIRFAWLLFFALSLGPGMVVGMAFGWLLRRRADAGKTKGRNA